MLKFFSLLGNMLKFETQTLIFLLKSMILNKNSRTLFQYEYVNCFDHNAMFTDNFSLARGQNAFLTEIQGNGTKIQKLNQ